MIENNDFFYKKLITWYLDNKRDLPWRSTSNPYNIWLSEIMLQQTRVAQGLPYYLTFISNFPTIFDLAAASEDEILKLWQGLGYYSRARNLHFTAKYIANELGGKFPQTYSELLKLKGVGDYTASAIASICFDAPNAVVDGNVYRVLARVFGIDTPINSTQGIIQFKQLAQQLIDTSQPGTYNQAIMEFGARYCMPQNPDCKHCIFNDNCEANKNNRVSELPIKLKNLKIRKRYFNYLVLISENNRTVLKQRVEKGIWQRLYEFPLVESTKKVSLNQLKHLPEFVDFSQNFKIRSVTPYNEIPVIHKLSHQHLYTQFWVIETSDLGENSISVSEIKPYAVPVLIQNFISEFSAFKN